MELVKVDQKSYKGTKDTVLTEFVRLARNVTHGIGEASETQARELLKKLAKAGHITADQETKLLHTLLGLMKQSKDRFELRVTNAIQMASKQMLEVSSKELERLEKKIVEFEKKIEKTSKLKR